MDISHQIPPRDVQTGAFVLHHAAREFPPGSVHLAVVDPGVGTHRRALVARCAEHLFVAPDNGLLALVVAEREHQLRHVTHPALVAPAPSATFHGRDLFAPVAARLAVGFRFEDVGPPVTDPVLGPVSSCTAVPGGIAGQIIHVDHFGNLVTNIDNRKVAALEAPLRVRLPDGRTLNGLCRTYADVATGEPLALIGSAGLLEISLRDGRANSSLGLARGAAIRVESC